MLRQGGRTLAACALGLAVTLSLVGLMMVLVNRSASTLGEDIKPLSLDYLARPSQREADIRTRERSLPDEPDLQQAAASALDAEQIAVSANQAPPTVMRPSFFDSGRPGAGLSAGFGPRLGETLAGGPSLSGGATGGAVPLSRIAPIYPLSARRRGIEGEVTVEFDIGADGSVENIRVVRSDPPGMFDSYVINAVQKWRYRPRMVNGEAQPRRNVYANLKFELPKDEQYQGGAGNDG